MRGHGIVHLHDFAPQAAPEQSNRRVVEQLAISALGLGQGALLPALVGHVADRSGGSDITLVLDYIGANFAQDAAPVPADKLYLVLLQLARSGDTLLPAGFLRGVIALIDEVHVGHADQFVGPMAEHPGKGTVCEQHTIMLDKEHTVAAVVEQHLVEALRLPERLFRLHLRGDVLERSLEEDRGAGRITYDPGVLAYPDRAAIAPVNLHPYLVDPSLDQEPGIGLPVVFLVDVDIPGARRAGQQQFGRRIVAKNARHGGIDVEKASARQAAIDSFGCGKKKLPIQALVATTADHRVVAGDDLHQAKKR